MIVDTRVNDPIRPRPLSFRVMESMGERIRLLRKARGLSQQQLADAIGVTKAAVSHWEIQVNLNIKLQPFLKLCDALGTDPQYLVYGATRVPNKAPPKKAV